MDYPIATCFALLLYAAILLIPARWLLGSPDDRGALKVTLAPLSEEFSAAPTNATPARSAPLRNAPAASETAEPPAAPVPAAPETAEPPAAPVHAAPTAPEMAEPPAAPVQAAPETGAPPSSPEPPAVTPSEPAVMNPAERGAPQATVERAAPQTAETAAGGEEIAAAAAVRPDKSALSANLRAASIPASLLPKSGTTSMIARTIAPIASPVPAPIPASARSGSLAPALLLPEESPVAPKAAGGNYGSREFEPIDAAQGSLKNIYGLAAAAPSPVSVDMAARPVSQSSGRSGRAISGDAGIGVEAGGGTGQGGAAPRGGSAIAGAIGRKAFLGIGAPRGGTFQIGGKGGSAQGSTAAPAVQPAAQPAPEVPADDAHGASIAGAAAPEPATKPVPEPAPQPIQEREAAKMAEPASPPVLPEIAPAPVPADAAPETPAAPVPAASPNESPDEHGAGREALSPQEVLDLVAKLIAERKVYPEAAKRRNTEGTVHVSMSILPDGSLKSARVERKSGSAALDRAALDLIKGIFPLPEAPGVPMDVAATIEYRLVR